MTERTIEYAREYVAKLAEREGQHVFASEVRAGCWDHRSDVQKALIEDFKPRKLDGEY